MTQDNEHVQKLIAARDREVAHRRDIAERLSEKYNRDDRRCLEGVTSGYWTPPVKRSSG